MHAEGRVVATVGVENLVIIDTPDAVLVAHRDHLQRVKDVVGELKARGHEALQAAPDRSAALGRLHGAARRPGIQNQAHRSPAGGRAIAATSPPSQRALGRRQRPARVTRDDDVFELGANQSTYIPVETRHRLENPGTESLVMIEVQCGDYLGEDDIVRFDDKYGRVLA